METRYEIETYQGSDGLWYWRLCSINGRVICDGSEGYSTASNARRGVDVVAATFAELDNENKRSPEKNGP